MMSINLLVGSLILICAVLQSVHGGVVKCSCQTEKCECNIPLKLELKEGTVYKINLDGTLRVTLDYDRLSRITVGSSLDGKSFDSKMIKGPYTQDPFCYKIHAPDFEQCLRLTNVKRNDIHPYNRLEGDITHWIKNSKKTILKETKLAYFKMLMRFV